MKFIILIIILFSLKLFPSQKLLMTSYLEQVRKNHVGYQAAEENISSQEVKTREGELAFTPNFYGSYQQTDDKKASLTTSLTGEETKSSSYSIGLAQNFNFGLSANLYYTLFDTEIIGASPLYVPQKKYYDTKTTLELKGPLWRNFLGSEFRAGADTLKAKALATKYSEQFKGKMYLLDAETTYIKLVLAREVYHTQNDSVERFKKIYDWSSNRFKKGLSEESDSIQAETALRAKELELKGAIDDERVATKNFNILRNLNSNEVSEDLEPFDLENSLKINISKSPNYREDTLALKETANLASLGAELAKEKNKPSLDLNLSVSYTGKDVKESDSISDSMGSDHPVTSFGVKFSTPLSFPLIHSLNGAYEAEKNASSKVYDRKIFEEKSEYENLLKRFEETKERISVIKELEKLQLKKLELEKERHKRGRTTTYQVLLFEQDYASTSLNRIRSEAELMMLLAEIKTYN